MDLNETLAYAALVAGIFLMIFATQFQPFALLAIIAAMMGWLFYSRGNIYVPFITKFQKDIRVKYGVEIPASEDAVIRQEGDEYIASVFMSVDVYETMTNKSEDEVKDYAQYFERTISSIKDPVKISTVLYERDISKYVRAIEDEKAKVESEIAAERQKKKVDERVVEVLERKRLMWDRMLESLYKSQNRPRAIMYILQTSARGASKEAAVNAAKVRAREIKATFGGGMSVRVDDLTHNRMKSCFDWEFMTPEW
ncbi:MAG: CPBP family intramembrane glutamic endopeptidase [Candidatus Micrarchaeia archaeon]